VGQVTQDGLKLNCTHQLSDHADDVNITGRSVCTIKVHTEYLVVAERRRD